ncbi:hypothetical protein Tco_0061830, partial [Tanacetum coccineum]
VVVRGVMLVLMVMVMVAMMYGGDIGSNGSDWRLEWPLWCVAVRGQRGDGVEEEAGWCDGWWWGPMMEVASDLAVSDGLEGDGVMWVTG